MLTITVPGSEIATESEDGSIVFNKIDGGTLQLEHSLLSISKWESKWHKNFIGGNMTPEQSIDYIKCMTVNQKVNQKIYDILTKENMKEISDYIGNPMTATVVKQQADGVRRYGRFKDENLTSELIYYYMITFGVPFECEKWHLNRLITLLKVCSVKEIQNSKAGKMSSGQVAKQYAQLNAARRAAHKTKG